MKRMRFAPPNDQPKGREAFAEAARTSRLLHNERSKLQSSKYSGVWREIVRPLDGEVWPHSGGELGKGYGVNPEASGFFRWLVFLKLELTYRELITLAEKDPRGHKKLLGVHRDYYRFRWTGGGYRNLRLKFNLDHFELIVQGLDFGMDELNDIGLGYCFDEICPCGSRHSGEFLRKLRTRVKQACDRVIALKERPTSFDAPSD